MVYTGRRAGIIADADYFGRTSSVDGVVGERGVGQRGIVHARC